MAPEKPDQLSQAISLINGVQDDGSGNYDGVTSFKKYLEVLVTERCRTAQLELFDQLWQTLYPEGPTHGPHIIAFLDEFKQMRDEISRRDVER